MDDPATWFVAVGVILLAAWWMERGGGGGACCSDCAKKNAAVQAVAQPSSACATEGSYV